MRSSRMTISALGGALALGLGALLSATGSAADATHDNDDGGLGVAAAAPDDTSAGTPELSEHGHVRKDLGERAGLTSADDGAVFFEITVDDATVTTTCPGRGVDVRPANGHFLVLDVTATLSSDATAGGDAGQDVYMPLVAETFSIVTPEGGLQETTVTDASWACFEDDELLPPFLEPGQTASGKIVLDAANDSGVVVYAPDGLAGWEWEFSG